MGRLDRFGEPTDDEDLPFGRRRCELCACLLDAHSASPWCRECGVIVSQRLAVATEEWRDYDGTHIVSERGRVARLLTIDRSHRYPRVSIAGVKLYVHQLLAETWHGPRPAGELARHLDDEPDHCTADNIAWGTPQQNAQDAKRNAERRAAVIAAKLRELGED